MLKGLRLIKKILNNSWFYSFGILLATSNVYADYSHYKNLFLGERAFGLAGAYTAIADDPSGLYYNPAGIVFSEGSSFSGSVNSLHVSMLTYNDALGQGVDYEKKSSQLLPNFFGMIKPLGKGYVGFSYAVPESELRDQDQSFVDINSSTQLFRINANRQGSTYKVGPSFAYEVNDLLAAGVTLYLHKQRVENIVTQWVVRTSGELLQSNYIEQDEFGIEPVLGVILSPSETVSIGLSLRKVFILNSESSSQHLLIEVDSSDVATITDNGIVRYDVQRNTPWTFDAGIALFPNESLLISADFSWNSGVDASAVNPLREPTFNVALGVEYYLNPDWALRAGLFTNLSNAPQVKANDGILQEDDQIDLYGGTLSFTHFTRTTSMSVGLGYSAGDGEAQVVGNDALKQSVSQQNITLFMGSTYRY